MNPTLRNILAVVLGWVGGSIINIGLVNIGSSIMPIPGVDTNDLTALAEAMPTLDFKYFIFPFLAHALGTLMGAAIAYRIAVSHKMKFAWAIGVLFLIGGIAVNYMLPGPTWFAVADIASAYLPMAWIGGKIAEKL
ncbi:hypothetical protein [Maribacter sp. 2308TA10-17]|uniref:hypothetical protein n=1 Tax=Maribacter sp. 2308TA10-17 TaxID=3386276 RepID=UPI0039BCB5CB